MLLTIAIPTYNRANYLKLCLQSISIQFEQDSSLFKEIEIVIVNNCSADHTDSIVKDFLKNHQSIKSHYIVNDSNIGLDGNITKAFSLANGNFALVFGDDDVLIEKSLSKIISILKDNAECGNIYINSFAFKDNYKNNEPNVISNNYFKYLSQRSYFERVNYYFTYTSGNIINKKKLSEQFELNRFLGGNVNLLNWIFDVIFNSPYNIVIEDRLIGMKVENTGGYGFAETFGVNQNKVFDFYKQENNNHLFDIINNNMLVTYFPSLLTITKKSLGKYSKEDAGLILSHLYAKNWRFRLFCVPILSSDYKFSKIYFLLIRIFIITIYKPIFWIKNYIDRFSGKVIST